MRVTIGGETDGLLLARDRFVEIGNDTETLKLMKGKVSEVVETCRLHPTTCPAVPTSELENTRHAGHAGPTQKHGHPILTPAGHFAHRPITIFNGL